MTQRVLHEEGHACERPARVGCLVARAFEAPVDDRVEPAVDPLDSFDRGVDEVARRERAASDELGLGGGVELGELIGHDRAAYVQLRGRRGLARPRDVRRDSGDER